MQQEDVGNVNKIKIFPTLIYYINNFIDKDKCRDIFDYLKHKSEVLTNHKSILNDPSSKSSNYVDNNILVELSKLNDDNKVIFDNIVKHIQQYSKDTGYELPFKTINSWFNIQNEGSVLSQHIHENTVIAGAFYIKVPENSSPIVFENPNNMMKMLLKKEDTKFSINQKNFYPKEGDLILFPSFLFHGSGGIINQGKDRTIISFNVQ